MGELLTDPIDVILPVCNEGGTIAGTLEEFHRIVALECGIPIRFVICEDGSTDNTVPILNSMMGRLPIRLISAVERKGYSRAVIDGFRHAESALVGCIDSDGQCDPRDFARFVDSYRTCDCDIVFGYRNPRRDPWARLLMSRLFGCVHGLLFHVRLRDPSCPFLLIRREALRRVLQGGVGRLSQGFWWEFVARCRAHRLRFVELPVNHRLRAQGKSRVYRLTRIPRIACEHLQGLFALKRELLSLDGMGQEGANHKHP